MNKFLTLLLTFFVFFLISCGSDDTNNTNDKSCNDTCKEWETCNEGKCVLTDGRCNENKDCEENETCNEKHNCIEENTNECQSDKDCPENSKCEDGKCVINTAECNSNEDCPEEKPLCIENKCTEDTSNNCIGMSFDDITVGYYRNELSSVFGDYQLVIGFYDADSPVGIYDLGSGNNSNYATCNQCVTVSKYDDPASPPQKTFFQTQGELEILQGDGRKGESVGEIRHIKLVEVTIADGTYESTPVEDGECIEMETGKTWSWNTLCEEGTRRCNKDDNTIEICQADHTWTVETACLETEECTIDVENGIYCKAPYCYENEKRCNENGNIEICKDDGNGSYFWDIFENCTNNTVCDEETLDCVEIPCEDGDKTCNADGSGIKTCVNGSWEETPCAQNEICTGNGETTVCRQPDDNEEWIKVSVESVQSCGIKKVNGINKLYCWGTGNNGRLGTGDEENKLVPTEVDIDDNSGWTDVSVGNFHACGIKNQKIYCWGKNSYGQLGDSTNINRNSPVEISGENNDYVNVEAGGYHTCGLKSDGSLYCWGRNDYGQLGIGTNENTSTPTLVSSNWEKISLGGKHSCGIKNINGLNKVYCWGYNLYGTLGIAVNNTEDKNIPTEIYNGEEGENLNRDWIDIFLGQDNGCALKNNNKMYCWGHNNNYKLGTGDNINKYIPTEMIRNNLSFASQGYYHSCVTDTSKKAYCWGRGDYGRLGTGNEDDQTEPTQIDGDNWIEIESGLSHNCGLRNINGKNQLYCWGSGSKGKLGTGNTENQLTPVLIR